MLKQDVKCLLELDQVRGAALQNEVEALKARRFAQNRKLARDVAAWVDTAMRIAEEKKLGGRSEGKREELDDEDDTMDFGCTGEEADGGDDLRSGSRADESSLRGGGQRDGSGINGGNRSDIASYFSRSFW